MKAVFARFLRDRSASTAIEYAVIGSVVSVAMVLVLTTIGTQLNGLLGVIAAYFN